jgi:proteasome lid subunit RPN8/RPN11
MTKGESGGMVLIGRGLIDRLWQGVHQALPDEACGLLIGEVLIPRLGGGDGQHLWRVSDILPMRNALAGSDRGPMAFVMDPQDLFDAQRDLRCQGAAVIGHYHSHPNGLAQPSPHDVAQITDPDAVWFIAAVGGTLSAWVPCDQRDAFLPVGLSEEK